MTGLKFNDFLLGRHRTKTAHRAAPVAMVFHSFMWHVLVCLVEGVGFPNDDDMMM